VTLMHRERIRHLPVVSGGSVLGVLSMRDLMGSLGEARAVAAQTGGRARDAALSLSEQLMRARI